MEQCVFCAIAEGKIPARKVYEDEHVLAFEDINPEAPAHVLIIPRVHIGSVMELDPGTETTSRLLSAAQAIAAERGLDRSGFRLVTNCGESAGQTVPHLHIHLLGGRSMGWPPG